MHTYYVYIVASPSRTIYIGVTNNLERRMWEHKNKVLKGFTEQYGVERLVYLEDFANIDDAIKREKQLKGWSRAKKLDLIERETGSGMISVTTGSTESIGTVTDRPACGAGDASTRSRRLWRLNRLSKTLLGSVLTSRSG